MSSDYIILRRLPVPLGEMQTFLDQRISWKLNKRVIPFSILYLELKIKIRGGSKDIFVRSQRYHDLVDFSRFDLKFHNSFFFNYNLHLQQIINEKQ